MKINDIESTLLEFKDEGKKMFITSSFQTHSIPLLHMLTRFDIDFETLFINTGFHFPETIIFRDSIVNLFHLKLIDVTSLIPKNLQKDCDGQFYFISDPDYCCFLNKVQPLEPYLKKYDVWINGIRADQSKYRSTLKVIQSASFDTIRFHPLLDWTASDIYTYREEYDLPEHPLEKEGYLSIGCEPCTIKYNNENARNSRWLGLNKTECGLHTDLVAQQGEPLNYD